MAIGRRVESGESSPMIPKTVRFAAVMSHPIQHYSPLFRALAAVPGLHVRVFYACDWGVKPYHDRGFATVFAWDVDLLSGYEHEFLPIRKRPRNMGFFDIDNPAITERLEEFAPHAIWLHGYGHRTIWRAASWAKGRAALLHFGDSELLHTRSAWKRWAKGLLLRRHFRRMDAFITIGDNNDAYYRFYGVPETKLFRGACPIDLARFQDAICSPEKPGRAAIRARFGLGPDGFVALLVGKLEERKRPLDLVEAVASLRSLGSEVSALLVGDGPLRSPIESRIVALGLSDFVKITGFVNQSEMPWVLEAGDVIVSASRFDPHPLVAAEGMAVGLPIVASDRVGCVGPTDAARPGVNALVYPCGDVPALAERLNELCGNEALRHRMSRASLELAPSQDVSVTVGAVVAALGALGLAPAGTRESGVRTVSLTGMP
jgi:glycosyltransferase involved in cell wall biosynthesis